MDRLETRRRAALFLDFDNIFSGLLSIDRAAALAFAEQPAAWLDRLAGYGIGDGPHRDFLICRAYLNPNGWLMDDELGNDNGRLFLQRFRPNLVRAGFEVIDCPALTAKHKNAADIRIVIDALTCLDATTRYEEIIIASSDSDFTPLLQRIRSRDRRTIILAAGHASSAYYRVANAFIDAEELVALALGTEQQPNEPAETDLIAFEQPMVAARDLVRVQLNDSSAPVALSNLGQVLREAIGDDIEASKWFGHGNLTAFIRTIDDGAFRAAGQYAWDPDRHPEPDPPSEPRPTASYPALVQELARVAEFPKIASDVWPTVFEALAAYSSTHAFNLTECTAWVRDRIAETDYYVGRHIIAHVIRGASLARVRLDSHPPPTATDVRDGFVTTLLDRAEANGLVLTPTQLGFLAAWVGGTSLSVSA